MRCEINTIFNTYVISKLHREEENLHWKMSNYCYTSVHFAWPSTCGREKSWSDWKKGKVTNVLVDVAQNNQKTLWKTLEGFPRKTKRVKKKKGWKWLSQFMQQIFHHFLFKIFFFLNAAWKEGITFRSHTFFLDSCQ